MCFRESGSCLAGNVCWSFLVVSPLDLGQAICSGCGRAHARINAAEQLHAKGLLLEQLEWSKELESAFDVQLAVPRSAITGTYVLTALCRPLFYVSYGFRLV